MNKDSLIYVAGHRGLAGSAILSRLKKSGYQNLLVRTSSELNLLDYTKTESFFMRYKPQYVFMCAGTVGGIVANNQYPVEFTQNNTLMAINVLSSAYKSRVQKLLYLGSSCIYPKETNQPIKEESLLTGLLEPTNEGYALSKILGIKLCSYYRREYGIDYISVMPSNLYGSNDNYHPENSHVIAALISRFHTAQINKLPTVEVWGSGNPLREFTHADDFADGVICAMKFYSKSLHLNIGTGEEISIKILAQCIAKTVGFSGDIIFNSSKPDGTIRKVMDNSQLLLLGWRPKISLSEGLKSAYQDYLNHLSNGTTFQRNPQDFSL